MVHKIKHTPNVFQVHKMICINIRYTHELSVNFFFSTFTFVLPDPHFKWYDKNQES